MATATEIKPAAVIADAIDDISDKRRMARGIEMLTPRAGEFSSELEMKLTGIALVPEARAELNDRMTRDWETNSLNPFVDYSERELIIGAGFHAAVYAASRVRSGFPKPVVVDAAGPAHIGGAFAVSTDPVFFLNSENRPGKVGLPGQGDALNVLPGALVQPSNVCVTEYPTNADMAFVIRVTLTQFADVFPGNKVVKVEPNRGGQGYSTVTFEGNESRIFGRVIDARGVGTPSYRKADGARVLTFPQFMQKMSSDFPFKDMSRIAVVGGGDSAKCAVESIVGIGPARHMSVPSLDFVPRIDWYAPNLPRFNEDWRESERGRYMRLSSYLPSRKVPNAFHDVTVYQERGQITKTLDTVIVNDRNYDMVIVCTGNNVPTLYDPIQFAGPVGSQPTYARQFAGTEYYVVGPAANIPFSGTEEISGVAAIPNNIVAMFRTAPRTSALAVNLPAVGEDSEI